MVSHIYILNQITPFMVCPTRLSFNCLCCVLIVYVLSILHRLNMKERRSGCFQQTHTSNEHHSASHPQHARNQLSDRAWKLNMIFNGYFATA